MKTTPPNPERIFGTLTGYQTSAALSAAIRLDLFTHVAAGAETLPALARATKASERGLRALANLLVAHEFLAKDGERYRCTAESALFLDARSPAYMGSVTEFLNGSGLVHCFDDALEAVRRGGTAERGGGTVSVENPVWVEFARAMQPMAHASAPSLADAVSRGGVPKRVLDVAAGHGVFGIELAKRSPATEVVFQDWGNVLAVARENAKRAGVAGRTHELAGSAFDVDFTKASGGTFDAILVTNFLHHFDRETCVRFLAKCRAALAPNGRVAVLEFALEEDRVRPPMAASFDFVMLATTPRGEAYTLGEFGKMFVEAELARPERHDVPGGSQAVLVAGAAR